MSRKSRTRQLSENDIDTLIHRLMNGGLTVGEAEEMIERLRSVQKQALPRLIEMLQDTAHQPASASTLEDIADTQNELLSLLGLIGDLRAVQPLLDLLDAQSVRDDLKLKIIGVLEQIDPTLDTAPLFGHLKEPRRAIRESQLEHLKRLQSPRDLSVWLEIMEMQMDAGMRLSWIRSTALLDDASAVPLFMCLCYDPDDQVALAAIDAVERFKDARALPVLEELAGRHPRPAVRHEARKATDRLRVRAALVPQVQPSPPPPLHACYLTTIDGSGGQVALITRYGDKGRLHLADIMFNDREGIKHCFGGDIGLDRLVGLLDELAEQGISPVRVSYEQWLEALDAACDLTWKAGQPLPMPYVAWRELIEGDRTGPEPSPAKVGDPPEAAGTRALTIPSEKRQHLFKRSYELLLQDEFAYWFFNPDEIGDLDERYLRLVEEAGEDLTGSSLHSLLQQGVREIVTQEIRSLIRGRLLRVAPLLREIYEEEEVWQWAVAAADGLTDDSALSPEEHPLLLGIVACSLENAVGESIDWVGVL